LYESGVDIIGSRFRDGTSSILLACLHGKVDLVRYLLDQGASPNDTDPYYGETCLMAAAYYAHPDCVSCLIGAGADVRYGHCGYYVTIIYLAACSFSESEPGDFEEGDVIRTIELLLDAGAPCDIPFNGKTALQLVQDMDTSVVDDKVESERDGIIDLLLSKLLELEELQSAESESEYDEENSDDDNSSYDEYEESGEEENSNDDNGSYDEYEESDEEYSGDDNGSCDESEESDDEEDSDDEMLHNLVRRRNHFL
ncbi:hypothetical protein ACHAWC_008335, partial [Mediolabrus comicus]